MKTVTTLILAARILLSLGIGTATAQGMTPASGEGVCSFGLNQAPGLLCRIHAATSGSRLVRMSAL